MVAFAHNNAFTNKHAWRCFIALTISLLLWVLTLLFGSLLGGLLHTRNRTGTRRGHNHNNHHNNHNGNANDVNAAREYSIQPVDTVAHPQSRWLGRADRVSYALLVTSVLLAVTIFLNVIANGVTSGFEVLVWIFLGLGVFWAFSRGLLKHYADALLILIIPLFIAMGVFGLRNPQYGIRA